MRDGAVRDGAVWDGAVRDRAVRDGAVRDGAVRDGAVRAPDLTRCASSHLVSRDELAGGRVIDERRRVYKRVVRVAAVAEVGIVVSAQLAR